MTDPQYVDDAPGFNWDTVSTPEFLNTPIGEPDEQFDLDEGTTATPSARLLKTPRRTGHAKEYEDKTNDLLQVMLAVTARNPHTVYDAAAILMHGDAVSKAMGDFAAENEQAARVLDFLAGGTNNAATALILASLPFALQIYRNHEPVAEVDTKVTIPFTRGKFAIKIPSRFKIQLTGLPKQITNDPDELYAKTLTPEVMAQLKKKGISVAPAGRHRAN